MVVYDLTDFKSFESAEKYIYLANENCNNESIKILVANKVDLEDKRIITK